MPYPNVDGKHRHAALFAPDDFLDYLRRQGGLHDEPVPESFVLCYSPRLFAHITQSEELRPVAHRARRCFARNHRGSTVGIAGGFGIGAPVAASMLEELTALGARRFVSIGYAGSLAPDLTIGETVVCTEAIRDEGVSHHYLAPGRAVGPSPVLTAHVERSLTAAAIDFTRGPTWTIDTPYRETIEEIRHYQSQGVLTVEMEAAALFAVAQYRGVEVAAAFVVSDTLGDLIWDPQFRAADDSLERLYRTAVDALVD
jgi:uridine phosphorylase